MKNHAIVKNRRGGQAIMMATVSIFVMLGMMSLVVDMGWAYFRREAAQTAADAAAAAVVRAVIATSPSSQACGTSSVWCGSPAGTATACPATAVTTASSSFDNGCMLAAANGYTTTGNKTVTIQANTTSPAPTVPGTTVTYWATVRVKENAATFFGPVNGNSSLTTTAIATAAVTSTGSSSGSPCLYILNPTALDAFDLGNGATVTTSNCGVYVNSNNSSSAMLVTGGGKLVSNSVQVVGGVTTNNGGSITSTPTHPTSGVADPFSGLTGPTPAGTCNSGNFTAWQATPYAPTAGTYCGFSTGNGMGVNMGPGTYIINGGTFSIQGGTTLTGAGVMVYLTNGATVNIANNANVTMSAESSGTYQGILFFQDRTMTSPGASTFAGGATMNLQGSLYFPNALLNINNGNSTQTEAVVAGSVNFQGGATFRQATSQSQTGLSIGGGAVTTMIQ